MGYDLIGDIHGHATKLRALLRRLGYREKAGAYRHPQRTAVFLGDLIDRGPEQRDVVDLVRRMVDAGAARAVMGNHEFNAIGWATRDPLAPERHLRGHTAANRRQHADFLTQFGEGSTRHHEAIEWFKTLPLYLDLGDIRAVHAWWHAPYVSHAAGARTEAGAVPEAYLLQAFAEGSEHFDVVQGLLKGLEIRLNGTGAIRDHEGTVRHSVRLKWWEPGPGLLRERAVVPPAHGASLHDAPVPPELPFGLEGDTPVFIGHYWLAGTPEPLTPRLACLDYGIGSGGPLVAYRWDGETALEARAYVCQH